MGGPLRWLEWALGETGLDRVYLRRGVPPWSGELVAGVADDSVVTWERDAVHPGGGRSGPATVPERDSYGRGPQDVERVRGLAGDRVGAELLGDATARWVMSGQPGSSPGRQLRDVVPVPVAATCVVDGREVQGWRMFGPGWCVTACFPYLGTGFHVLAPGPGQVEVDGWVLDPVTRSWHPGG